jgi:2-oxoglutarate dehydrogenase E1 component
MTPKSLLRHKMSVSPLSDLSAGRFNLIIPETDLDATDASTAKVNRLVFCSGKVYFDLMEARQIKGMDNVAIIRIEQLYPFPIEEFSVELERYKNAKDVVWCQEEPQNQGAWYQIRHRLQGPLTDDQQLYYAGRPGAAAPASGVFKLHTQQQQALVDAALGVRMSASKSRKQKSNKTAK